MTYRGVYRDGIVTLDGDVDLRNGAVVEVNVPSTRRGGAARPSTIKTRGQVRRKKTHPFVALAGIWEDRADWRGMTSEEIVESLRSRSSKPAKEKPSARTKGARRG
jgi:hypothetical protein